MPTLNSLERAVSAQLEARGLTREPTEDDAHVEHDLVFQVPTREGPIRVVVELEQPGRPPEIDPWPSGPTRMVAEPYVSSSRARSLRAHGIPYVDSVGNMWLDLPGFHVEVEGRARPAGWAPPRATTDRLSRPSSLTIVFALLTSPSLLQLTLRELASACHTSLGAAQATLADLGTEGFLSGGTPTRSLRRTGSLAERWSTQFRPRLLPKLTHLEARGPAPGWWFDRLPDLPPQSGLLGGEAAYELLGHPLRATETLLYGSPPWGSVRKAGRLGDTGESVVTLREQFWPSAPDDAGLVVPSLLVYADLHDSEDPRLRAAAGELRERDDELRRLWAS